MDKIRMTIRLKMKGRDAPSRKQILKAFHRIPFGKIVVEQAKRRIDRGGDSQVRYKPLWADTYRTRALSVEKEEKVSKAEKSLQRADKRLLKAFEYRKEFRGLIEAEDRVKKAVKSFFRAEDRLKGLGGASGKSYRAGGKPLLDTRQHVYNTLNAETHKTSTGMEIRLRGSLAAVFHHNGFKTNGPNFIPLTRRAVRDHRPGADPRHEGLVRGVDYIMMWKGVTVPARPIFRLAPEDKRDIIKTVELHLRKTFRTKRKVA